VLGVCALVRPVRLIVAAKVGLDAELRRDIAALTGVDVGLAWVTFAAQIPRVSPR
tara:strand:- start:45 stop:209 length:165 start_codon:yes stop_codon:yes gene_type:complete